MWIPCVLHIWDERRNQHYNNITTLMKIGITLITVAISFQIRKIRTQVIFTLQVRGSARLLHIFHHVIVFCSISVVHMTSCFPCTIFCCCHVGGAGHDGIVACPWTTEHASPLSTDCAETSVVRITRPVTGKAVSRVYCGSIQRKESHALCVTHLM